MEFAFGFIAIVFFIYFGYKFVIGFFSSTYNNLRVFLRIDSAREIEYIHAYGFSLFLIPLLLFGALTTIGFNQFVDWVDFLSSIKYSHLFTALAILLLIVLPYLISFILFWGVGKLILLKLTHYEKSLLYSELSQAGLRGNFAIIYIAQTFMINILTALLVIGVLIFIIYLIINRLFIPLILWISEA
jgi:hypothetical protein